ncbi:MAG: M55 family metallopeptidase [Halobacteriales archaeon]|nr:M55 family metallopeptidase [Halobacteriales archaeon]
MRVFISADMEGISGIATPADVVSGESAYGRGQELMHGDVNAAIAGALAGGAETIVVNDSHSSMTNLERNDLHEAARLIRGNTKPRSMMQGLEADHDVAMFVGYHAKAGTAGAVLNHTFIGHELVDVRINGESAGEMGWNARLANALEVPVGLVTGDDKTTAEATVELGDAETITVKDGIDRFTADCKPPAETTAAIHDAAQRAVERAAAGEFAQPAIDEPITIEAEWSATNHAHRAGQLPGIERIADRATQLTADTYPTAYERTVAMFRAGADARNEFYG